MTLRQEDLQVLQENGFRITLQRRIVLEVMAASEGSLTAEDIYHRAKQINPRISLTTVYRTLSVLEQNHLIEQRYLSPDHERSHFVLAGATNQFHFHCLGCGRVVEFGSKAGIAMLLGDLRSIERDVHVKQVCICVEGYCPSCSTRGAVS